MHHARMSLLALAALLAVGACDAAPTLETRTYALQHLDPNEAAQLIDPYIYGDREGAPGAISGNDRALTVRETADNLERIERVLAEYDQPQPDIRLHFQLIEADGFTDRDPRIAEVEAELRELFRFDGYRLAGEAFVTATDGSEVMQGLQGSDDLYEVFARVYRISTTTIRLDEVRLEGRSLGVGLQTTVNIRPGQTLVLGSSPLAGSTTTLLLAVRAEDAG